MIIVGGVLAGFGYASDSLAVAVTMIVIGFGLIVAAVFGRKTEK